MNWIDTYLIFCGKCCHKRSQGLNIKHVMIHMYVFHRTMLPSYMSSPHPLSCWGFVYTLMFMNTKCQMVHAINHLTWLTNLLPMRSKNCPPSRLCYSNAISKRLFANYLLKSPSNNGGHHLACLSLDIIMDKFSTIAYPNCHNFILGSKHFVCSGMARWIESWH